MAKAELTGLEKRLLEEPNYRPYCLRCKMMTRMKLLEKGDQRLMWCEPVMEDHPLDLLLPGVSPKRWGCGLKYNIHTGEVLVKASGPFVYKEQWERG